MKQESKDDNPTSTVRRMASREASEFPTRWEHEVRMLQQLFGRWPFVRVRCETTITKIVCLRGQSNIHRQRRAEFHLAELRKLLRDDIFDNRLKRIHTCRRTATVSCSLHGLSGPHFKHNTTNAPDINLRIIPLLTINDLRSHPKHAPLHRSVTAHRIVVRFLRHSEIRDLTDSRVPDENVVRFQILG